MFNGFFVFIFSWIGLVGALNAALVDFSVITMKNDKDVVEFLRDRYGSKTIDIKRQTVVGVKVKPTGAATKGYFVDLIFLAKDLSGKRFFSSINTYSIPNTWGGFLAASERILEQKQIQATDVTHYEGYWAYQSGRRERDSSLDYTSVKFASTRSGNNFGGWVVRLRDGDQTLKIESSLFEARQFFEKNEKFINEYVSKRLPLKPDEFEWISWQKSMRHGH